MCFNNLAMKITRMLCHSLCIQLLRYHGPFICHAYLAYLYIFILPKLLFRRPYIQHASDISKN